MPISRNSSGVYRPNTKKTHFSLVSLSVRPRVYTAVAGSCCRQRCYLAHAVHVSSHTPGSWCPTLLWVSDGTGANNLASSRLESWALDDSSVEITNNAMFSLDSTKCPHKYRDIEYSAKYLNISVRGVLDIMNNERPRRQSTAKNSASLC